MMGEKELKRI